MLIFKQIYFVKLCSIFYCSASSFLTIYQRILWGGSLGCKKLLKFTCLCMKFNNCHYANAESFETLQYFRWNLIIFYTLMNILKGFFDIYSLMNIIKGYFDAFNKNLSEEDQKQELFNFQNRFLRPEIKFIFLKNFLTLWISKCQQKLGMFLLKDCFWK